MEELFELVFGGILKASKSRKVPMPIRIILTLFIDLFILGIGGVILAAGILAARDSAAFGVVMIVVGAFMLLGWLRVIFRRFANKRI